MLRKLLIGVVTGLLISSQCLAQSGGAIIGSSSSGAMTQVSCQSPSGTGVVTFNSISGSYNSLRIKLYGESTVSATFADVRLTFNNDTGSNYDYQQGQAHGASVNAATGAATAFILIGDISGATGPANFGASLIIDIPGYAGTTFQKSVTSQNFAKFSSVSDTNIYSNGGDWRSTAAVTRLDLTLSSGNWVSGSQICLYGIT